MNTSLFAQPEVYRDKPSLPIQIPKEHLEQWFVQALQVEAVGAGSYPIDILKPNEWGADVKMLSCKVDKNSNLTNGDSGETSLAQKFVGTGISLDDMFKNEQYQDIIDGWTSIWKDKLVSVKSDKNIDIKDAVKKAQNQIDTYKQTTKFDIDKFIVVIFQGFELVYCEFY